MEKKQEILKLYYEDNVKIVDIVKEVKVSRAYISKIITVDERYRAKKIEEKEKTRKRKKEYTYYKMKEIREEKAKQNAYVKEQHLQATRELSRSETAISNRALLKWNASAYKYNSRKNCYEFDKRLIRSYALPKYMKFDNYKK